MSIFLLIMILSLRESGDNRLRKSVRQIPVAEKTLSAAALDAGMANMDFAIFANVGKWLAASRQ